MAICPVCTVAVGTDVGLCRWLGIDDVLSGIWIGGLIISMIGLRKNKPAFKYPSEAKCGEERLFFDCVGWRFPYFFI